MRLLVAGELARADCIIADVTHARPNIFYEIGLADAMGKALFILSQTPTPTRESVPFTLGRFNVLSYKLTPRGLKQLVDKLTTALEGYLDSPRQPAASLGQRFTMPFRVDWDRLDPAEAENLFLELLAQMGYRRLEWNKESRDVDGVWLRMKRAFPIASAN